MNLYLKNDPCGFCYTTKLPRLIVELQNYPDRRKLTIECHSPLTDIWTSKQVCVDDEVQRYWFPVILHHNIGTNQQAEITTIIKKSKKKKQHIFSCFNIKAPGFKIEEKIQRKNS